MQRHAEIEERILGLIMGIGIGTIIGFLLRASERGGKASARRPHQDQRPKGATGAPPSEVLGDAWR